MGSIRPLFTITVLVVVGALLYAKINEGPAHSHVGLHGAGDQSQDGIPPLAAASGGATLDRDTSAPAWPSTMAPPAVAAPAVSPATANTNPASATTAGATPSNNGAAKGGLPDMPPIPDLPELPSTAGLTTPTIPPATTQPAATQPVLSQPATTAAAVSPPTDLPKDIPTGRYGDETGPNLSLGASPPATASPQLPANPAVPPGATAATTPPPSPSLGSALPPASSQSAAPPAAADNPLRPAPPAPAAAPQVPDRYGNVDGPPAQPAPPAFSVPAASQQPVAPAGASFATSWPAIQTALDRGDLKQAHQMLSKWHGDESLSAADSQKVETLLGQLAGTVIYSTEYQLEPTRAVKPGENLETIAKEYNVPWQLLAKINGFPASDQLRPGQQLKVIRGPFSAVVDLHRNELYLDVDGRYAGKFPVTVSPGSATVEGQWVVDQKLVGAGSAPASSYAITPVAADRTIILRGANSNSLAGGPILTIASGSAPASPTSVPAIRVAPQDAEEIADILSIGSRVVVRR